MRQAYVTRVVGKPHGGGRGRKEELSLEHQVSVPVPVRSEMCAGGGIRWYGSKACSKLSVFSSGKACLQGAQSFKKMLC